jgi:hypothetical protein
MESGKWRKEEDDDGIEDEILFGLLSVVNMER